MPRRSAVAKPADPPPQPAAADPFSTGKGLLLAAFPDLVRDIIEDAKTKKRKCAKCEGQGAIDGKECIVCEGSGETRQIGDKHARDLIFKAASEYSQLKSGEGSEDAAFGDVSEVQEMMEP